jgi:hypothetical protein
MTWRQTQLDSFENTVMIQQDHELVEYMKSKNYTKVYAYGDVDYFDQFVDLTDCKCDFGIYIVNQYFDFSTLINHVNWVLDNCIRVQLYLAINKFFAVPNKQYNVSDDYDIAIKQLINEQVRARIDSYQYQSDDQGQYFNFAHPLTRFYLSKI